jgi:acetyltransferase-like isoleucine patch superfamily enzyme
LSLRWRCRVWPSARIEWPGRLRIGRKARLYGCRIVARGRVELGAGAELHDYAFLDTQTADGVIEIGARSAVGPFTVIYGSGGVSIGKGCSIAGQSMIVSSTHITRDVLRPIREQGFETAPIRIDDDVWLGAQCTVLPGAVIGEGAIVGANSLVRGEVPPKMVVAGTPARPIQSRSAG